MQPTEVDLVIERALRCECGGELRPMCGQRTDRDEPVLYTWLRCSACKDIRCVSRFGTPDYAW